MRPPEPLAAHEHIFDNLIVADMVLYGKNRIPFRGHSW